MIAASLFGRGSIAVTVTAAILGAGCAPRADEPETLPPTRGIILVSLDTLRADHLGLYGYTRDTSPFLDSLAERSLVFEQATAQYPSTLTSHMTMFTGLYPAQHAVYPPTAVLADTIETLPERLSRAGFATAGYTEGGYVRGHYGFRRGFDDFRAIDRTGPRQIEKTFARGVRFLETLAPDRRFFLFLHSYAPHTPYEPPEGYRGRFWQGEPPIEWRPTGDRLSEINRSGEPLDAQTVAYLEALYDETIRYVDDVVAGLFADLDRLGLTDTTTVILTSDHGEEFQEHGKLNHTQLYHETLHVPLIIHHPALADGRRVAALVESVDLLPTILSLAGLAPEPALPGDDLLDLGDGTGDEAWAEGERAEKSVYLRRGERLLHLLSLDHGERLELYDTRADPRETTDLAPTENEAAASLARALDARRLDAVAAPGEEALDPQLEERLRALGYLD